MTDWSKTRILLVHSDIHVRRWAHEVLHKQKVAGVQSTRSPATGIDLLKRFTADVALVQLVHPEMTAVDFMRRVRESRNVSNPGLPVVAIVDSAQRELVGTAEATGITATVSRKATPEQLLERIAGAIAAPRHAGATAPRDERLPAVAPATTATAVPSSKRTGSGQGVEIIAPRKTDARSSVALVDAETPTRSRHSAEDWTAAVAPTETPADTNPENDFKPALDKHKAWLRSRGGEGERANLEKADLHGQSLHMMDLTSASLREADLSDTDCRQAVFTSADLRRANLSGADLSGANLSVANLRGAKLRLSKLSKASLRGADLAGACLTDTSLAATDFEGANLLDTDLRRSDLTWAVGLTQSQVERARADSSTLMPIGIRIPELNE